MQYNVSTVNQNLSLSGSQALYGGLYTEQNVAISGIHTHSGPGGYLQFVLYDITSLGFVPQSYDALVYGILEVLLLMLPAPNLLVYCNPRPVRSKKTLAFTKPTPEHTRRLLSHMCYSVGCCRPATRCSVEQTTSLN